MTTVKNSKKKQDILTLVEESTSGMDLSPWEGTVREYLPLVLDNPEYNDTAHARICRMVEEKGVEFEDEDNKRKPVYKFFQKELFGIDHVLSQVMEFFRAAAKGSDARKRLLLLWGPTSSGKSEFLIQLKKGLELFSKTTEGKIFAIDGCPMYENPLNAIPAAARKGLKEEHGIIIEGELCPRCAYRLQEEFGGDFWKIPVRRIFLSEMNRIGIGTFQPGDTKSQSQSELVGSVNFAKLEDYGVESHPLAYNFDGELNVANRGIMEFIELLKVDPKFRHILLTLAQEKRIKVERFPLIYADLVPIGHSVLGETPIPYKDCGLIKYGTMEDLYNNGRTDIEVLATNDSGEPVWTKVKSFYRHAFTGDIVRTIQCDGIVETTYNHSIIGKDCKPFYPADKYDLLSFRSVPQNNECQEFILSVPKGLHVVEGKLYVKPTGDKKSDGEFGKYGIDFCYRANSQKLNDILKILAWFVTEGHVNDTHAVISQANVDVLQNIKESVERVSTTTASIYDRTNEKDGTSRLHLSAAVWRKMLEHNCGKYAENKKLPNFVFNLSEEAKMFLINELIDGDGSRKCFSAGSEEYKNEFFEYKTTSKILAAQLGFLLAQLNIDFSTGFSYTKTGKEAYRIRFRHKRNDGNRTNKIEKIYVENIMVYDIECEENHSFTCGIGNVVCHNTNETEFVKFKGDKKEEALHDRLWLVPFPYNLEVDSEVKIYEKLIYNAPGFKDIHIAPHTLKTAAMFAILSRLEEPKDKSITLLQKMHLYNSEEVDGFTQEDVKELQKTSDREGLDGISPRYIVNRLSACLAKHGTTYITPISALRSIKEGLPTNAKLDDESVERLENLISLCVEEYNKTAMNEVQKAFFVNFEYEIKSLLENYLDNVGAYLDRTKCKNEWDELVDPDEELMRSVEEKVEITSTGKDSFRSEIYRKMLKTKNERGEYDWQSHPKLKEALQKQLFEERADTIRLTVSSRNPEPEALKKLNAVIDALVKYHGYTAESANELLRYVNNVMSRSK